MSMPSFPGASASDAAARDLLAALASGHPVDTAALARRLGLEEPALLAVAESLRARGLPLARTDEGLRLPWPLEWLDAQAIRAALPPALRELAIEVHWELDSTSSELLRRVGDIADESFVLAETQSAGRGRRGRHWLSPPGLNLYLSCRKRFAREPAALTGLSLAVGVMVVQALARFGLSGLGLKWPNDVVAEDGKLAGILVELAGERGQGCAAVIGIGLNVRLTDEIKAQIGQPACDLATLCGGRPPARNRVAAALIEALHEGLHSFDVQGFGAFHAAYAACDVLRGRALRLSGAVPAEEGVGAGVDARGALLLRTAHGLVPVDSGEVTVRPA